MKRLNISLLMLLAACAISFASGRYVAPVGLDSISYGRQGDYMVYRMNVDLTPTQVRTDRAQILTPLIVSDSGDTLELKPVGVYGRQRYIKYLRNVKNPIGDSNEVRFLESERPSSYSYAQTLPWSDWMDNSTVLVRRRVYGCANCIVSDKIDTITSYFHVNPAIPEIVYFPAPEQGPKIETLEGEAFINFVVNTTDIRPTYRNNTYELGKVRASIDTVISDPDVRVTGIWLKGFASPESPYSHNRDLAMGRTAALKDYIGKLYKFPDTLIDTDYEPEDWEGLRKFVVNSQIDNREAILELIDSNMEPDAKEAKIKRLYPREYKYMLDNFYPVLRHTNYRISYEIQRFDDVAKIREVMRRRPSRLSLREFFILGNSAEPGSDEFNEVFETAVKIYPDNQVANINAASAAMQRGDYVSAEKYLARAGDQPEAIYARGALAFIKGDYDEAEALMNQVTSIDAAKAAIKEIHRIRSHNDQQTRNNSLILK